MTEDISKSVKTMLNVYENKGLLITHGILKHFAILNASRCLDWTLQMIEPYILNFLEEEEIKSSLLMIKDCIPNPSESKYKAIYQMTWQTWNLRYKIWEGPKPYLALARLGWASQFLILYEHFSGLVEKDEFSNYDFVKLKDLPQGERQSRLLYSIGVSCGQSLDVVYGPEAISDGHLIIAQSFEKAISEYL